MSDTIARKVEVGLDAAAKEIGFKIKTIGRLWCISGMDATYYP